jgi:glyoxylase-like metal-dependent hydrolase (beta-lactamase superfamily II)
MYKYSVISGNSGNTCDRFCKGHKDNPSKIIAVIPTHYHDDNLGGLHEFHRQGDGCRETLIRDNRLDDYYTTRDILIEHMRKSGMKADRIFRIDFVKGINIYLN